MGNSTAVRQLRRASTASASSSDSSDSLQDDPQIMQQMSDVGDGDGDVTSASPTISPRRSARKKQAPRRLLNQALVGDKVIESKFDECCGLDQPGRNVVLDEEFIAQREEEENGNEIFRYFLKPAGWKCSISNKLDSSYIYLAEGETTMTAEEGVTMFHSYKDIWRKWKSDAEFRKIFRGDYRPPPREKIFPPRRLGRDHPGNPGLSSTRRPDAEAEVSKPKSNSTSYATPKRHLKRGRPPSSSKKLPAKRPKSKSTNDDTLFASRAEGNIGSQTSDCSSIDSMELAAALGGYRGSPGLALGDTTKAAPTAHTTPTAAAAATTAATAKRPRGRPPNSSSKAAAEQSKSNSRDDDLSSQSSKAEGNLEATVSDCPSIDSMELAAALGGHAPNEAAPETSATPKKKRGRPPSSSKKRSSAKQSKSKSTSGDRSVPPQAESPAIGDGMKKVAPKADTTPKRKHGRHSSSKKPQAKQSKSTDGYTLVESQPESPKGDDSPSIESMGDAHGVGGHDVPPAPMASVSVPQKELSEPSPAERKRFLKLQNEKIMLEMELENERLKQELAKWRKENGGS
ncbi:unnamed protein product [Cylindrotheca closterium]|uniref:Uncharacterized protein n=1 Tax=Cylindrotheca closterium TaxID=2856 RepID=A0AAD2FSQ9_9STRA|nr:unnamed protein product [Cylindrotheca closterium]